MILISLVIWVLLVLAVLRFFEASKPKPKPKPNGKDTRNNR